MPVAKQVAVLDGNGQDAASAGCPFLIYNGTTTSTDCGNDAGFLNLADGLLTAESWIRADGYGQNNGGKIIFKGSDDGRGWDLRISSTLGLYAHIECATADAKRWSGLDDLTADGLWHHVAMVWDDATYSRPRLFIDGVEPSYAGGQDRNGAIKVDGASNLILGCDTWGNYNFNGAFGWTRISGVLRYTANFTPAARCSPPDSDGDTIALFKTDEGEGVALDNAEGTAARDGTISNGTWGSG